MRFSIFSRFSAFLLVSLIACSSAKKEAPLAQGELSTKESEETRVTLQLTKGAHLYERTSGPSETPQHGSDLVRIDQLMYLKVPMPPVKIERSVERPMEHAQWIVVTEKNAVTLIASQSRIEIAPHSAVQFRFAPLMQSDLRVYYGTVLMNLGAQSAYSEAVVRFEKSDFTLKSGLFSLSTNASLHAAYLMNLKGAAQVKQPGISALDAILVPAGSVAQIDSKGLFIVKPRAEDVKTMRGFLKNNWKNAPSLIPFHHTFKTLEKTVTVQKGAVPQAHLKLSEILKNDAKSWNVISPPSTNSSIR